MNGPLFSAVSVSSARRAAVMSALSEHGVNGATASHVAATTTLAGRIREMGNLSVDIDTIIDLAVMLGLDTKSAATARNFPKPDAYDPTNHRTYDHELEEWRSSARGTRIGAQVTFSNAVRETVRDVTGVAEHVTLLFDGAAREFGKSVQLLIASGVTPADLDPSDEVGILARDVWERMEQAGRIPRYTAIRDLLWADDDALTSPANQTGAAIRARLEEVLSIVFGGRAGERTLAYHGFYFYTPLQWRFFRTVRLTGIGDQMFVVHDDGSSGVFETWRRYFSEPLMPAPVHSGTDAQPSVQALALSRALAGDRIDAGGLVGRLALYKCETPADFIEAWKRHRRGPAEKGPSRLNLFAPDLESIDRLLGRFSGVMVDGSTDLAQLPIGSFLLALHDCLVLANGWSVRIEFDERRLRAIFSSGMLDVGGTAPDPVILTSILRRALPYFRGCENADDWISRADTLRGLVRAEVVPLGARTPGASDVDRIKVAVFNPLRLVPWADLSVAEADLLHASLASLRSLALEISSKERQSINDHLTRLRPRLQNGMRNLPEGQRKQVENTVEALGSSVTEDLYVSSLVEMVRILLGSEVDFGFSGEGGHRNGAVLPLRALDALGYEPSAESVHVANLADGSFPSRVRPVSWPFRLEDIRDTAPEVTLQLLSLRTETSALSDLYLLWLALDGAAPGKAVILSWIVKLSNELRNPSPIVSLLARPDSENFHESVIARVGGVPVESVSFADTDDEPAVILGPRPPDSGKFDIRQSVGSVDPRATASAFMCPRRFAIQWAMGPTAAFPAPHHQQMLYGNVHGRMARRGIHDFARACRDLWLHLTDGERQSSMENRRVVPESNVASEFTLTLGGNRKKKRPIDKAYRAAIDRRHSAPDEIAPTGPWILPPKPSTVDATVCAICPVRERCLVAES